MIVFSFVHFIQTRSGFPSHVLDLPILLQKVLASIPLGVRIIGLQSAVLLIPICLVILPYIFVLIFDVSTPELPSDDSPMLSVPSLILVQKRPVALELYWILRQLDMHSAPPSDCCADTCLQWRIRHLPRCNHGPVLPVHPPRTLDHLPECWTYVPSRGTKA